MGSVLVSIFVAILQPVFSHRFLMTYYKEREPQKTDGIAQKSITAERCPSQSPSIAGQSI
jgi:hypothetical protein